MIRISSRPTALIASGNDRFAFHPVKLSANHAPIPVFRLPKPEAR